MADDLILPGPEGLNPNEHMRTKSALTGCN